MSDKKAIYRERLIVAESNKKLIETQLANLKKQYKEDTAAAKKQYNVNLKRIETRKKEATKKVKIIKDFFDNSTDINEEVNNEIKKELTK